MHITPNDSLNKDSRNKDVAGSGPEVRPYDLKGTLTGLFISSKSLDCAGNANPSNSGVRLRETHWTVD
ncbi:MAG: hypothetical protein NVS1B11_08540 [Terriglobales bacterium]